MKKDNKEGFPTPSYQFISMILPRSHYYCKRIFTEIALAKEIHSQWSNLEMGIYDLSRPGKNDAHWNSV